jgi:hypothetical protein
VGPEAAASPSARGDAARELARDVAHWDQLGCLSPVAAWVTGAPGQVDAFAADLAAALAELAETMPRGAVAPEAAARIHHERSSAELRAAAGQRVALHAGAGFTVIREATAEHRPAPLHRFVRVHPADGVAGLLAALAPLARHLAAVGVAGFGGGLADLAGRLAALGASRVCALGRMQSPPVAWRHDNRPVLVPLARYATLDALA